MWDEIPSIINVIWNYLSIPELERFSHCSMGKYQLLPELSSYPGYFRKPHQLSMGLWNIQGNLFRYVFHLTLNWAFDYYPKIGLPHWNQVAHICVSKLDHHWFRWWLVAWSAPSHYLKQWWYIVNWIPRNKLQWNFNRSIDRQWQVNSVIDWLALLRGWYQGLFVWVAVIYIPKNSEIGLLWCGNGD